MERSGIEVARINSQNNLFFAEFFLSIFSFVIYNEVGVGREERIMIRQMKDSDWKRVAEIYTQGLEGGFSTFNTECPSFEAWDSGHIKKCRFVDEEDGQVVGWIAIGPTSSRPVYRGCVEVSVYIHEDYRGKGIGTRLLKTLIDEAREAGYWMLYSAIFSINKPSVELHRKCGFREVGYRERIAKDRFGNWQNTTIMEYRM